jgi:hypothetical protein
MRRHWPHATSRMLARHSACAKHHEQHKATACTKPVGVGCSVRQISHFSVLGAERRAFLPPSRASRRTDQDSLRLAHVTTPLHMPPRRPDTRGGLHEEELPRRAAPRCAVSHNVACGRRRCAASTEPSLPVFPRRRHHSHRKGFHLGLCRYAFAGYLEVDQVWSRCGHKTSHFSSVLCSQSTRYATARFLGRAAGAAALGQNPRV